MRLLAGTSLRKRTRPLFGGRVLVSMEEPRQAPIRRFKFLVVIRHGCLGISFDGDLAIDNVETDNPSSE